MYNVGQRIRVVIDGRRSPGPKNVREVTVVADDERGVIIDDGSGNPNGISKEGIYGDVLGPASELLDD